MAQLFLVSTQSVERELNNDASVTVPGEPPRYFEISAYRKRMLPEGLDEMHLTMTLSSQIESHGQARMDGESWLLPQ